MNASIVFLKPEVNSNGCFENGVGMVNEVDCFALYKAKSAASRNNERNAERSRFIPRITRKGVDRIRFSINRMRLKSLWLKIVFK